MKPGCLRTRLAQTRAGSRLPSQCAIGERAGAWSLQQISPDQAFVSFDTGMWPNGCELEAYAANGAEGESDRFRMGRIVRTLHRQFPHSLEHLMCFVEGTFSSLDQRDCVLRVSGRLVETVDL